MPEPLAVFAPDGRELVSPSPPIATKGVVRTMSADLQRTCPSCGNEFSRAMEFCPVCMLQKALPGAAESGASSVSEDTVEATRRNSQRSDLSTIS